MFESLCLYLCGDISCQIFVEFGNESDAILLIDSSEIQCCIQITIEQVVRDISIGHLWAIIKYASDLLDPSLPIICNIFYKTFSLLFSFKPLPLYLLSYLCTIIVA